MIGILSFTSQLGEAQKRYKNEFAFGLHLDSLFVAEGANEFDTLFNRKIFLSRVKRHLNTKGSNEPKLLDSLVSQLFFSDFLFKLDTAGDRAPLEFVQLHQQSGTPLLRFRDLSRDTPVSYIDILLKRTKTNFQIIDFYDHYSATWFSEEVEQAFIGEELARAADQKNELWLTDLYRLRALMAEKDYEGALTFYTLLPKEIKQQQSFLLLAIQASVYLPYYKEETLLKWSEKLFADQPAFSITKIHLAEVKEDYQSLIEELEVLKSLIGNDPYLQLLKADANFRDKDYEKGKLICEHLIKSDDLAFEASLLWYQYAKLRSNEKDMKRMSSKLQKEFDYSPL